MSVSFSRIQRFLLTPDVQPKFKDRQKLAGSELSLTVKGDFSWGFSEKNSGDGN